MQPLCVAGIDAGQRFLDLGLAPSGQTARFHNTQADIARLVVRSCEGILADLPR